MIDFTPPHEFMCETADVNAFIIDAVTCPKSTLWHWPSFYLMYVELDRLINLMTEIRYLLDSPFGCTIGPLPVHEFVGSANDLFGRSTAQQKAVARWFWPMSRNTKRSPDHPGRHERLEAHAHPKGGWLRVFNKSFCAGRVAKDGKTLSRTILPTDPAPSSERIPDMLAECMLRPQLFDIETTEAKQALARAAADAGKNLGKIATAMHQHLVEHCTIHDLMYPSSR